ncbi:MAG: peptidoglycan DD-metalloendopeptidase family protein [Clostridia bacterium]|nr:peptidoglycan DD-metalloendopeptidase family protein [Clostridia bacterium]
MKRKVISLISIATIVSCFFFMPTIKAETLQDKKNQNEQKQQEAEDKLEYVKEELSDALVKIQEMDDQIRTAEKEIEGMDKELLDLQKEVTQITNDLNKVQERYDENQKLMEKRMVVMYETGDISYLDLLLHSSNLVEFLSNYYIIEQIMESDNNTLDEIEKEKDEIETTKIKLEEKKAELKLLRVKKEQTKVIMQNNKTIQQVEVNKLSEQESKLQKQIQEYKDEQDRLEKMIALVSEYYVYNGDISGAVMTWPVAKSGTYITSGYGVRVHPIQGILKGHTGIDIGNAGYGAPVIAAADGIVTLASYYGGYGNCVMINHGNGVSTLYGHGQAILTEVGKEVKRGEIIMEVGSTGQSTGPHLHFEVRINGSPVNPLPYLGYELQEDNNSSDNNNTIQINTENNNKTNTSE